MDRSNEHNVAMEAGQAGYTAEPSSPSFDEKFDRRRSTTNSDSSTKQLQSTTSSNCTPYSLARVWANVKLLLSRFSSRGTDQGCEIDPVVRTLESIPRGFPGLAAFLDSDECFSVYRRFGFIQSRLLLDKQDKLRELEEELDALDKHEEKTNFKHPMTTDLGEDDIAPRRKLLATIEQHFNSYVNLLSNAQKLMAINRPSEADYRSVMNYMMIRNPLLEAEGSWVYHKEDLVTLRPGREHAWLDRSIEKMLKWFHCAILESVFGDERTRQKSLGDEVYYVRQRISNVANSIITFMVLILLVVPVYLLYHLINDAPNGAPDGRAYAICMGVLIVSTLAFSAVLSLFTRARRHEILAAAAAYCAVLVVFLGNVNPNRR